jgi:hypothetical protein
MKPGVGLIHRLSKLHRIGTRDDCQILSFHTYKLDLSSLGLVSLIPLALRATTLHENSIFWGNPGQCLDAPAPDQTDTLTLQSRSLLRR